jgi:hypothetical protein
MTAPSLPPALRAAADGLSALEAATGAWKAGFPSGPGSAVP